MGPFVGSLLVASAFILGALVPAFGQGLGWSALREFLPALAVLVAAYVGAREAFRLNRLRETEIENTKRLRVGNQTINTIRNQLVRIVNIRVKMLDPVRNEPFAHLRVLPFGVKLAFPQIDLNEIGYVLDSTNPSVFSALSDALSTAENAMVVVNELSRLIREEVHPKLEANGVRHKATSEADSMNLILGDRLVQDLSGAIRTATVLIDRAENDLITQGNALRSVLIDLYPRKFVQKLV